MSTVTAETSSRVDDSEFNLQTRGMRVDDWLLPDVESTEWSTGETTAEKLDAQSSSETARAAVQGIAQNVSAPVRKDKLAIPKPVNRVGVRLDHRASSHADSHTTRVATTDSAVEDSAASTRAAMNGSNERQSPRLDLRQ